MKTCTYRIPAQTKDVAIEQVLAQAARKNVTIVEFVYVEYQNWKRRWKLTVRELF